MPRSCHGAEGCAQHLAGGGSRAARLPASASCPQLPYGQRSARRGRRVTMRPPCPRPDAAGLAQRLVALVGGGHRAARLPASCSALSPSLPCRQRSALRHTVTVPLPPPSCGACTAPASGRQRTARSLAAATAATPQLAGARGGLRPLPSSQATGEPATVWLFSPRWGYKGDSDETIKCILSSH